MKVKIPVGTGKKKLVAAKKQDTRADIGLTQNDCICATMAPHCPVHVAARVSPAPGQEFVR